MEISRLKHPNTNMTIPSADLSKDSTLAHSLVLCTKPIVIAPYVAETIPRTPRTGTESYMKHFALALIVSVKQDIFDIYFF